MLNHEIEFELAASSGIKLFYKVFRGMNLVVARRVLTTTVSKACASLLKAKNYHANTS